MASLQADHGVQVGYTPQVQSDHGTQTGYGNIQSDHGVQTGYQYLLQADHGVRAGLVASSAALDALYVDDPSTLSSQEGLIYRTYGYTIKLYSPLTGPNEVEDITSRVGSWQITQSRGSPATLQMSMSDEDRELRPILEAGDTFYQKLDGDTFDNSYTVRHYFQVEIHTAGETWKSPWFLQTEYTWVADGGQIKVEINATDLSEILLGDNQSMDDFVSTVSTQIWTAKQVIAAILAEYGITQHELRFTDYPVPRFSPQGRPLDWIKELLWVRQAEWYWDQDVFVAKDREYIPATEGSGTWIFTDRWHLSNLSYRRSIENLRNEFTVRKVEPYATVLAEIECYGGQCLGFNQATFLPARVTRLRIDKIANGIVKDAVWYGAGGIPNDPLNNLPSNSYIGSRPTEAVRLVYEPSEFQADWVPELKVTVIGKPVSQTTIPDEFTTAFTLKTTNAINQAKYGIRPELTPVESQLIATEAIGKRLGELFLEESLRNVEISDWTGPLHPFVLPGQTITIRAPIAGMVSENYYVETITKSGAANNATMSVTCSKFP